MPNWEEIQKEWETTRITLAVLALQLEDIHLIWRMMSLRGDIVYSIQNFKKLADLQEELKSLKVEENGLFESKVRPEMKKSIHQLHQGMMEFFKKNGLELSESEDSVLAQYKKSSIIAIITNQGFALSLSINSKDVDEISSIVSTGSHRTVRENSKPDALEDDIIDVQNEIDETKGRLRSYSNPKIIFRNKNNQSFATSEEVIKQYFG